jgi:hypothetical protein
MITIHGLTVEQKEMLDVMWSIDSVEDFENWINLLDYDDYMMARSLSQLIIAEYLEEAFKSKRYNNFAEAKSVIEKFRI